MDHFPPPDDDPSYVSFRDVSWLQAFGLNVNNVMEYFALSQFFDRSCNNQVVRMQLQFTNNGANYTPENILHKLKSMTGNEYDLGRCHPPRLFIIHKQFRNSPTNVNVTHSYYVLDGCIYQSPSLYSVLSHRILSSMSYLQSSIEYADKWLEFDPTKSRYSIKSKEEESTTLFLEEEDIQMEKDNLKDTILPDKDKMNFITQINNRFMSLPK